MSSAVASKGMNQGSEFDDNKDMCPICKTDRYLSPDVRFLVNPECYHCY